MFHVKHLTANVNRLSMIRNELSCLKIWAAGEAL